MADKTKLAKGPALGNVPTSDSYIRIVENIQSLQAGLEGVSTSLNQPRSLTADQLEQVRRALQAGGVNPLNLTALPGITLQPQDALIPEVTKLPAPAVSKDGQVVIYRKVIWRFSTRAKKWSPVSTILLLDTSSNLVNYPAASYAPGVLFYATNTGVLYIEEDLTVGGPTWVPAFAPTLAYRHASRHSSGNVSVANNNAGALVTELSGPGFFAEMAGQRIWIAGNLYGVSTVDANNNTMVLAVPAASNNNEAYVFEFPSVDYPLGSEFYETDRTVSYIVQNANGIVAVVGNNVSWVSGVQFDVYWPSIRLGNNVFAVASVAQNRQALVIVGPAANNNNTAYSVDRGGWWFKGGAYSDTANNIPTDMDPILDLGTQGNSNQTPPYGGFRFHSTDYRHTHWWAYQGVGNLAGQWGWAPEETGVQYIVSTIGVGGPDGGLWGLCDGTAYPVELSSGGTGNVTTPNLSSGAFLRGGGNNIGSVQAANAATWATGAHTDTTSIAVTATGNNANNQITGDEAAHTHTVSASTTTLNYNVGVSSQIVVTGLNTVTSGGTPHNHTFDVAGANFNGNVVPNPHSHNLSNNNAVLNPPSDANHGLPINIGLYWWMRR